MQNTKKIIDNQYFKPAWWLKNAHAQTIWPIVRRRNIPLNEFWERVDLPDGDFVDLVFDASNYQDTSKPAALLLHGMEGGINSGYIRALIREFSEKGFRPVLMHFRGCSGAPNRMLRTYHSGDTGDLAYIVKEVLIKKYAAKEMVAVGVSLGANVLLKWLGETKEENPFKKCVAISVPFELDKVVTRLMKGVSKIYQWYLLKGIKDKMRHKYKDVKGGITSKEVMAIKNFKQFDEMLTAPLHGFENAKSYYKQASCRQFLSKITVPTLIVHARDDPFMTPKIIPSENELSHSVQLLLAEKGGHVGFVSGRMPGKEEYWIDKWVPNFFGDEKLLK